MTNKELRDRDSIVTSEGIFFRVYGYTHPPEGYICDVEYASSSIYRSKLPRAERRRTDGSLYYKFYADEGLRFVRENFPNHLLNYKPLGCTIVGVKKDNIYQTLKPEVKFREIIQSEAPDQLISSLKEIFYVLSSRSSLKIDDFGVFGSILHSFYHPDLSDIDLIIYGAKKLDQLKEVLNDLYGEGNFLLNEFDDFESIKGKRWRFINYTPKEYLMHQRRKLIYAVLKSSYASRKVKVEFEPVKDWSEIINDYDPRVKIKKKGWIKAIARITNDREAPFMPSIYDVEIVDFLEGEAENITRIVSYVEEFRMQAFTDEVVYVEGNLEEVIAPNGTLHQITLSYGPRYYEQVLKLLNS